MLHPITVREGDGSDILDVWDSSQALSEPCVTLGCCLVYVVLAWLALGVAIDDAVFAAEALLRTESINMTWGALGASLVA